MSNPSWSRRARTRALALVSAGAVVTGAFVGVPGATAAPEGATAATPAAQRPAQQLGAGRYVVLLRQPGATRYEGGVPGLRATKATRGRSFDARGAQVNAYTDYLQRRQNRVAASVGAEILTRTTLASNAFTAKLTGRQASELAADRDVLMLTRDTAFSMDTWHTPEFLGLAGKDGQWDAKGGVAKAGAGTVVGVLDSGIWPESGSFAGPQLPRNPNDALKMYRRGNSTYMTKADGSVFRGYCEPGQKWVANDCNSKLIGARYYPEAFLDSVPPQHRAATEHISTRDGDGHGSHTASTAAGNYGVPASVEGRDFGTVSGMAPAAKIAAYKVCWEDDDPDTGGCYTSATLDAVDDAVADGVDVINYSISGATDTVVDAVEYAFLGAAAAGVFVATSAGNSGPGASTVAHNSPWVTTVAASTHYNYENTLQLGDGTRVVGASVASDLPKGAPTLVLAGSAASAAAAPADAERCFAGTLDPAAVTGKVVVCDRGVTDRVAKSAEVKRAGGVGMVLANVAAGQSLDADFHSVPTIHVGLTDATTIKNYVKSAAAPTGTFLAGNQTGTPTPLPQIAGFSSRGPAVANDSDVIKPDISAPGVSVLAAVAPPTNNGRSFDLYSGTSMSSPHIAGLAAFILGVHPDWSPMAVKSAMMTTAYDLKKPDGSPDQNPFNEGAGHVDPTKFFEPGLVVTSGEEDWLSFFEGQGFELGDSVEPMAASDLNIPSIAQGQVTASTTITRTFTGLRAGTWTVDVDLPGFDVSTDTSTVTIGKVGDAESVTFDFTRDDAPLGKFATGFVTLTGPTTVRLPVALRPVSVKAPAVVRGTGATGSVPVEVTAGYTGDLDIVPAGLAKAVTDQGSLAPGTAFERGPVEIPAGTQVARFDADAANDGADLDLYVYRMNDAGDALVALAGQSATGSADESVTLTAPAAGKYYVVVDGYAAAPGESTVDYRYDEFVVGASGVGDLAADPNPLAVAQGVTTSFDATWSGLESGRYLGLFSYDGALAPTYLYVDVP